MIRTRLITVGLQPFKRLLFEQKFLHKGLILWKTLCDVKHMVSYQFSILKRFKNKGYYSCITVFSFLGAVSGSKDSRIITNRILKSHPNHPIEILICYIGIIICKTLGIFT